MYPGKKEWGAIGDLVGRSADDCAFRWKRVLHPRVTKGPWTPDVRVL
jgi:hypothetical protein